MRKFKLIALGLCLLPVFPSWADTQVNVVGLFSGKAVVIVNNGKPQTLSVGQSSREGVKLLSRTEGIIPALESAHAIAYLAKLAPQLSADDVVLLNLSGRGDKDMVTIAARLA